MDLGVKVMDLGVKAMDLEVKGLEIAPALSLPPPNSTDLHETSRPEPGCATGSRSFCRRDET